MSIYILQGIDRAILQRHNLSSTRVYLNRPDTPEVRDDSHLPEQNKPTHCCCVLQPFIYKATTLDLQLVPASTTDKANRLDNRPVDTSTGATKERVPRYDLQQRDATSKYNRTRSTMGRTEPVDKSTRTDNGGHDRPTGSVYYEERKPRGRR
jgi:hypothetical protein